jgi:mRNA-degrading endonuclease toxin of MazEF toxin-antitoxin module
LKLTNAYSRQWFLTQPASATRGFESASDVQWLKHGVFDVQGIGTYPSVKLIKRLGTLPEKQLVDVELRVRRWLGLA